MPAILFPVLRFAQAVMPWLRRTRQPKPGKNFRFWHFRVKVASWQILHLDFEVSKVEIETSAPHFENAKLESKPSGSMLELPNSKLESVNLEAQKAEIPSLESEDESSEFQE